MLSQIKDTVAPTITILTPKEGSSYGTTVVVEGTVTDAVSANGGKGRVESLSYQIVPATLPGGNIPCSPDGTFVQSFDTGSFVGPMIVVLTAVDWNNNSSEARLNLTDQGAIPSFAATPQNNQVTLRWDPVPLSGGYTLYYTTDGSLPSQQYGNRIDAVESPFALTGLANGSMHVFLLQAHAREGRDNWSEFREAIPLSVMTLAPRVSGQYRSILVEWNRISATDEFDVLRSASRQGTYATVASRVRGQSFSDAMAEIQTVYYYRVRPALAGSVISVPNPGETAECPTPEERIVGSCTTPGAAMGIVLSQGYAYVAAGDAGLAIVDISDPTHPRVVSSMSTQGVVCDLAIKNGYAYCADDRGLQIIDIENPALPTLAGSFGATPFNSIDVIEDRAYITSGMDFQILDIADPTTPVLLGTHTVSGSGWFSPGASDAVVRGNVAYVLGPGLEIVDISNPASPQLLSNTYDLSGPGMTPLRYRIALAGNYVFGPASELGMRIVDVGDPAAPLLAGAYDTPGIALGIAVHDNKAFVADGPNGLSVLDVSTPANPKLLAWCDTPDICNGVAIGGELAYVADTSVGIQVIDFFSPMGFSFSSIIPIPDSARSLVVSGRRAYIASGDGSSGLMRIVDISQPALPAELGSFDAGSTVNDITVSGDFAFLGTAAEGLQVVDVSDPLSPSLVASLSSPFGVELKSVRAAGNYVLTGATGGLALVDVSAPSRPVYLSSYITTLNSTVFDMAVRESQVFVADGEFGMRILDFSNPRSISQTGTCDTPGTASSIALSGSLALIADGTSLQVVDISNTAAPVIAGSLPMSAFNVTAVGSYAFISSADEGIKVVDCANPASPVLVGTFNTPGSAGISIVNGGHLYVCDSYSIQVLRFGEQR